MTDGYTQTWLKLLRNGRGIEASDKNRTQLNAAIAKIAYTGVTGVWKPHIEAKLQKAAKDIMHRARSENREPLEFLVTVCDEYDSDDVYPEAMLISTKYTQV